MNSLSSNPNVLASESFRVTTPNGTLFAFIAEKPDGTVDSFQFILGKAGADTAAWASAVAGLMTLLIAKGATIEELIDTLGGITSGRESRTLQSCCRSGPEGIWMALMRYKRSKFELLSEKLGLNEQTHKGPSVAPWAKIRSR